jgi:hypothetical protein
MALRTWYDPARSPLHMLTCDACATAYDTTDECRHDAVLIRAAAVRDGWTVVASTPDLHYCELCSGSDSPVSR